MDHGSLKKNSASRDQITVLWTGNTKYSASRELNIVSRTTSVFLRQGPDSQPILLNILCLILQFFFFFLHLEAVPVYGNKF